MSTEQLPANPTKPAIPPNSPDAGDKSERPKKQPPLSTPGAITACGLFLFLALWFLVPWWITLATISGKPKSGSIPFEIRSQIRSIERRLTPASADTMGKFFPEGRLFSYSFYGFTLVNVSVAHPNDTEFTRKTLTEIERILPTVESLRQEAPFYGDEMHDLHGGIIPIGHANLLRAGYAVLGGNRQDIIDALHAESQLLYDAFQKSPVASLESYPGMIWPVDNCCALESLRLHDFLYGTDYSEVCRRWEGWMKDHLDEDTGMMPAQIAFNGTTVDGPRGCALSWSLAFMPGFAPNLARYQYQRYRESWFIHHFGTTGVREWAPGRIGTMDADTGPVVRDIGAAASGFGIAAARANGDWENLKGMLRGMELIALPIHTITGEKSYFGGTALLPDILAVWGKTVQPWDRRRPLNSDTVWPPAGLSGYIPTLLLSGLLVAIIAWRGIRSMKRSIAGFRRNPNRWSNACILGLVIQCIIIAAWLLSPKVSWFYAAFASSAANTVELVSMRLFQGSVKPQ